MINLSVTGIIKDYHVFSREFWLSYKAIEAVIDPIKWESIKIPLLKSKKIDEKILSMVNIEEYNLKRAEIDQEWIQKNEEAKNRGNVMHEQLHNMLITDLSGCKSTFGIPTDIYKVMKTEQFKACDGLFPEFRMEVKLDDDITLIGIADLIIKDGSTIKIIDYKTDDKIERDSHFDLAKKKKKCMKYPLSRIPDCNLSHYQIQLSMYAWMIQQIDPNLEITELEVMHIQDGKLKKIYTVDYIKDTIEQLLKWHIKSFKLKIETDKCKEIKY